MSNDAYNTSDGDKLYLGMSVVPPNVCVPIHWTEFILYFGLMIAFLICNKTTVLGQMKCALYCYNIPLFIRALMSTIIWALDKNENSEFYGIQLIIYKFLLFIAVLVGFKMKKVEILINFDQCTEEEFERHTN